MTNLPTLTPAPPTKAARPSIFKRWVQRLQARFTKVKCPICGSSKTYPVEGMISWQDAADELSAGPWPGEQGLTGVPQPSQVGGALDIAKQTRMPGFQESFTYNSEEHHRCRKCKALLPPQFWAMSVGRDVAIAVTGAAEHGKTTWLLSMLTPPDIDTYDVLRRTRNVVATSYTYAEPYTIEILETGFRSSVPYTLLGSTVRRDTESIGIRTLDIRGEHFTSRNLPKTKTILNRHLRRSRVGALLVVDRFVPRNAPPASQPTQAPVKLLSVGKTYEEISLDLRETIDEVWKAVIWTFLDCAEWTNEADALMQRSTIDPAVRNALVAIAQSPLPNPGSATSTMLSVVTVESINGLREALGTDASLLEIEGFVALMFRLQLLYTFAAARSSSTKYDYYENGGNKVIEAIVKLAGALYKRTDAIRGTGVGGLAADEKDGWQVLPCGRVGTQSVWSDLILVRAVDAMS